MKTFEEYLELARIAHGHLCAGQILGVRMAMYGVSLLGLEDPQERDRKRLVTFVEIDRCATDAIGVVTGCRLGKRALKFRDWGRWRRPSAICRRSGRTRRRTRKFSKDRARELYPEIDEQERAADERLPRTARLGAVLPSVGSGQTWSGRDARLQGSADRLRRMRRRHQFPPRGHSRWRDPLQSLRRRALLGADSNRDPLLHRPSDASLDNIRAGCRWHGIETVQIREKDLRPEHCSSSHAAARAPHAGPPDQIVVNGRADVALAAGAHGVHLRSNPIPPAEWKRRSGPAS